LKPLQIIRAAEHELTDAVRWYHARDPRVAERFAAEVRRALHLIETFPQIGSRVPDVPDGAVRRMPVHTFPYNVVFADLGDRIEVVAIAHNRRRPAYFLRRLRRS
jgi:toxin ParE1/3/4